MQVTIVVPDRVLGIDGNFVRMDELGELEPVHAVQFNSDTGFGCVEYAHGYDDETGHLTKPANDILPREEFQSRFSKFVDRFPELWEVKQRTMAQLSAESAAAMAAREDVEKARDARVADLEAKVAALTNALLDASAKPKP